jgi:glycosyltransferase involved in cell wall biosynthesis
LPILSTFPSHERTLVAERIVDLPSVIPYRPLNVLPDVASAPSAERGYITFACFNRISKISEHSIELWARLLRRLPDARLLLKSARSADESALRNLLQRFAQHDVDPDRVSILPHSTWRTHMESYAQVDIALDPQPHGGGISLIEGLLMGVPTLAMQGTTMPSRLAHALLHAAGMDDWVAADEEAFIDLALEKCADPQALARVRAELRQRTLASPLADNVGYTAAVEARYRELWCEQSGELIKMRERQLQQARAALLRNEGGAARKILPRWLPRTAPTVRRCIWPAWRAFNAQTAMPRSIFCVVQSRRRPTIPIRSSTCPPSLPIGGGFPRRSRN